ncbi:MAG TPA: AAA family ATPase, partial [Candidatus Bathyarchaeia archaeon]|nr:AAA family ATPase [Candidatus Bathyarchaeia archaeon]
MRFESVTADAFGPFVDRSLELARGLTIVHGANESGKSSWHAALYAALCGMRRGRGQARDDREFVDRHRPWSGEQWRVSAHVRLEDGREIELRHDLAGRVDSRATDVALGRDVSGEIIHDGSPDGSRWLGLDRQAFLATACVRQAELLRVHDDPAALQEHLQRAAATAGRDATAGSALGRLVDFVRENVGQNKVNATKPLRRAVERADRARTKLDEARREHGEFLAMLAELQAAESRLAATERELRVAEAAHAARESEQATRRLDRARSLAAVFPDGPPRSRAPDGALALEVAAALADWESRPEVRELDGPTAAEVAAELATLPVLPPAEVAPPSPEELRKVAWALDLPEPFVPPELESKVQTAQSELARLRHRARIALAVGSALIVAGVLAMTLGERRAGAMSAIAGLVPLAWGVVVVQGNEERRRREALGGAEIARDLARRTHQDWADSIRRARERTRELGLADADARALLDLAEAEARRPDLARELEIRRAAERGAGEAEDRVRRAGERLRGVARRCDVNGADEAAIVGGLGEWNRVREREIENHEAQVEQWAELGELLGGASLDAIEAEAGRMARRALELRGDLREAEVATAELGVEPARRIEALRKTYENAAKRAAELRGKLSDRADRIPSVAVAEEERAAAETELERVHELEETLQTTIEYLERAQERVHRDVAPILAASVRDWLPRLTGGRYVEAAVDPLSLDVWVSGPDGERREAIRLSHGTAEQIYLLLRVAMAAHLTGNGEVCPL